MTLDLHTPNLASDKIKTINQAFDTIKSLLMPEMVNLTPKEKQTVYNTPYKEKVPYIKKMHIYMKDKPELTPSYINTEEFLKDYENYMLLQKFAKAVITLKEAIDDTSLVLWKDIINVALTYLDTIELASKNNVPGSTTMYKNLKGLTERKTGKAKANKSKDEKDNNPPSNEDGPSEGN